MLVGGLEAEGFYLLKEVVVHAYDAVAQRDSHNEYDYGQDCFDGWIVSGIEPDQR